MLLLLGFLINKENCSTMYEHCRYGGTNVHQALCRAVAIRQPTYAFPVHCLDSLQAIGKPHSSSGRVILKDCMSLRPGTLVEELYTVMCHYPVNLLTGDFVRAEVRIDGLITLRVLIVAQIFFSRNK